MIFLSRSQDVKMILMQAVSFHVQLDSSWNQLEFFASKMFSLNGDLTRLSLWLLSTVFLWALFNHFFFMFFFHDFL